MNKQQKINRMLKGIKARKNVFNTYGRILKISLFHVLLFIDLFIPTFRLLSLYALKFKHIELFRITLKN